MCVLIKTNIKGGEKQKEKRMRQIKKKKMKEIVRQKVQKIILITITLFVFGLNFNYGKKIGTITDVVNPYSLQIDNGNLYIVEGPVVYIYSLKNLKQIKKFGKKGEGPKEFMVLPTANMGNINIEIYSKYILINSIGKISFFSKDGKYLKEMRTSGNYNSFKVFGNKFVGFGGFSRVKNIEFIHLRIYDSLQSKGLDFFKQQNFYNPGEVNPFLLYGPNFFTADDKIYVEKNKDEIQVFDQSGKHVSTIDINQGYKKKLVKNSDKNKYLNYFKNEPAFKSMYRNIKRDVNFFKYFPGIRLFELSGKRIYVIRWTGNNDKTDIGVYDLNGKLIRNIQVPFIMKDTMIPYAYTINNDILYQLIENEEDESKWDVFSTEIK